MNKGIKIVNILWTGGWDSTYRVIELSRKECIVQPIYITGDGRYSEQLEIAAMDRIKKKLQTRVETKARFMPIKFIDKNEIPINEDVSTAYNIIRNKTHLGIQHEWLARYAYLNPGLEIGTEAGVPETSHIIDAIQTFGVLVKKDDTYVLDKTKSTEVGLLVLGNFEFPIIDKDETQMLENIKAWGYEEIMKEIWFCHRPIDGQPCGLCHPCAVKIESNMGFLIPEQAKKRYSFQKKLSRIIGKRYSEAICKIIYRR